MTSRQEIVPVQFADGTKLHIKATILRGEEDVAFKLLSFEQETDTIHVFDLEGHPTAKVAYAWSSPVEGSDRRKFYAVLHVPPVDSPEAAVRAAIVADHRSARCEPVARVAFCT